MVVHLDVSTHSYIADNVWLFDAIINDKHGIPDPLSIQQIVIPSQMNIFTSNKYSHDSGLNVICIRNLLRGGGPVHINMASVRKCLFVSCQVISLNSPLIFISKLSVSRGESGKYIRENLVALAWDFRRFFF